MPTYEYECKSCGHTFEVFQAMSDEPLTGCPECGKAVRRLIFGGTGVIFKGSGFYVTDKGKSAGASVKTPKPGETATSGGSSEQNKPAASSTSENSGAESAPKKAGSGEKAAPAAQPA
jgi:putative FmdB family regulatory protein